MTDIPRNGLWDWEGRIARLPYFLIALATAVAVGILTALTDRGASALLFVPLAPMAYISVLASIKRLHDLDVSGWYCLVGLIPLVNFVFTLYLFFAKGHAGVNRYGPPPIDQSNADTPPHPTNSASTAYVAVEPSRHSSANANAAPENAALQMTKSPMPAQETLTIDEDAIYAAIAKELKTGATDEGLWTRLFAECDGDENKTKVAYIKRRVEKITAIEQARITDTVRKRDEEASRLERLRVEMLSAREKFPFSEITQKQAEEIKALALFYTTAEFFVWVRFNNLLEAESLLTRFPLLVATWENQYGDTPLHIAVKEQHLDMVRLLLERGSPTVKTNMDGHTPMDIAKKTGNREIVELLSAAE